MRRSIITKNKNPAENVLVGNDICHFVFVNE
jgi:hypothetical protein